MVFIFSPKHSLTATEHTIPTIIEQEAEKVEIDSFSKPKLDTSMHTGPLTASSNGQNVNKVWINSGTGLNIITLRTMMTILGLHKTSLLPFTVTVVVHIAGSTIDILGALFLNVKIGPTAAEGSHFFYVADCTTTPFDVILGREWIHRSSELAMLNHVAKEDEFGRGDAITQSSRKKIKSEFKCDACPVNTTSESCFKMHLKGKKHAFKTKANQIAKPNLGKCKRPIRWCKWEKPKIGWTKLNTDGSASAAGGLLRDNKGEPLCAFVSKVSGNYDTLFAELWAICFGLIIASILGIKLLWVESDSLSAVKSINREHGCNNLVDICCLKLIWKFLEKFEVHSVTHTWREANRAADYLSKMVVSESEVCLMPGDFSDRLNRIIKEDAQGKYYYRA